MNGQCCGGGVRFRLFPKPPYVHPEWPPETIAVSDPPGSIGPGPADERIHIVNPIGKRFAYGVNPGPLGTPQLDLPPWKGPASPPVCPDAEVISITFLWARRNSPRRMCSARSGSCSTSGSAISAGGSSGISPRDYRRLEIVILPGLNNAYAGYGFMEVGAHHFPDGSHAPYALNFDVIAHELGHLILYSTIGLPTAATQHGEYYGFQESGGRHDGADRRAAFRIPA